MDDKIEALGCWKANIQELVKVISINKHPVARS
jgi:hypothetical protein